VDGKTTEITQFEPCWKTWTLPGASSPPMPSTPVLDRRVRGHHQERALHPDHEEEPARLYATIRNLLWKDIPARCEAAGLRK
jgi:hypothetical protein